MKFSLGKGGEVKVVQIFKDAEQVEDAKELYAYLKKNELFKGNLGEIHSQISYTGDKVLLVGLGEKKQTSSWQFKDCLL